MPLAFAAGCHSVVRYREEDFVARVREITGGAGVQVAYDAVGKDTFFGSMECLAPFGHLANYGQASGAVPAFEVSMLFPKSNSLSRPSVFQHVRTPQLLRDAARRYFAACQEGALDIPEGQSLARCAMPAKAHALLEDRSRLRPWCCGSMRAERDRAGVRLAMSAGQRAITARIWCFAPSLHADQPIGKRAEGRAAGARGIADQGSPLLPPAVWGRGWTSGPVAKSWVM